MRKVIVISFVWLCNFFGYGVVCVCVCARVSVCPLKLKKYWYHLQISIQDKVSGFYIINKLNLFMLLKK